MTNEVVGKIAYFDDWFCIDNKKLNIVSKLLYKKTEGVAFRVRLFKTHDAKILNRVLFKEPDETKLT